MRAYLCVAIVVVLGCAQVVRNSSLPPGPVVMSATRSTYLLGETVTVEIRNSSKDTISLDCFETLERLEQDGSWGPARAANCSQDRLVSTVLYPGMSVTRSIELRTMMGPGTYRVTHRLSRRNQPPFSLPLVVSEPFEVKPANLESREP